MSFNEGDAAPPYQSNTFFKTTHYINKQWNRFSPPNTLELLSLTTWNGVNLLVKFLLKQLRLWVLALAPRHTKEVAYQTLVRPQLEYAAPIWHPYNETETKKGGESAGDGIMPVASMTCLNLSGHPWRTAG